MKINRKELLDTLSIVSPGVSNKEMAIEQATTFAFLKDRVVTYNDEISISHPIEGMEGLEGAIEAKILYPLLERIKEETIELTRNKNSEIVIKAGKMRSGLLLQKEIDLPIEEEIEDRDAWTLIPENLIEALSFVVFSAGRGLDFPILSGIHVSSKGFVEASDGYRMARYALKGDLEVESFVIPASNISSLIRLPNITHIAQGIGWIHFKTEEGTEFSSRIFEESYPNATSWLKLDGKRLVLPETIEEVLSRAVILSARKTAVDEEVIFELEGGKFRVVSECDVAWFEEEVEAEYEGSGEFSIRIAPSFLKDILKRTTLCLIGTNKIKFVGEGWEYVSLLKV